MRARAHIEILVVAITALSLFSCKSAADARFQNAAEAKRDDAAGAEYPMMEADEIALQDGVALDKAKDKKKPDAKKTWKRSTIDAHSAKISIGDRDDLPVRGMQVFTRVDGFRARVLIDFYFVNDRDGQYEGTFKMRLPDGATPYYLAFGQSKVVLHDDLPPDQLFEAPEVARKHDLAPDKILTQRAADMIDPIQARMVPKQQAQRAYKDTVRRAVDPALMEWAGPGVFNARLFPIAPKAVHRVVVGYDMNLTRIGDDLELLLPIPADIPEATVNLDVSEAASKTIDLPLAPTPLRDSGRSYYRVEKASGKVINLRLTQATNHALTGLDTKTGDFFAARVAPEIPVKKQPDTPGDAILLVDKSLSSNPDKFNVWLTLARALLDENRPQIKRFGVILFDIEARAWKKQLVENTPENVEAFIAYANTMSLEGATNIANALDASTDWLANNEGHNTRHLFLLSDGAVTWGESDAWAISTAFDQENISIFSYNTGMSGSNKRMLEHLTRETGGAVFSVVGEDEIKTAATAHRKSPWLLRSVSGEGIQDVIIAGRPRYVYPGQRLFVTGRGKIADDAKLTFTLESGATKKEVTVTLDEVIDTPLTRRAYGQIATEQLEEFLGSTRPLAGAYARHFRVVGKTTSLLMLETEEDYKQHNIVPADDARAVSENLTTILIANALDQLAMKLGDPRAALLDQIETLKTAPGVMLELPPELVGIISSLDKRAFVVPNSNPLAQSASTDGIPANVLSHLATRKLDYDIMSVEAARRSRDLGKIDALRALSSLVEASPGDLVLARDVGYSAIEFGMPEQAYYLFRNVSTRRPDEPETWRSMAASAQAAGQLDLATIYYEIALAGRWDSRFGEFRKILAADYLRMIKNHSAKLDTSLQAWVKKRQPQLQQIFGVSSADVVVTITWNTDGTDVDLHVIEPTGEECYYSHPRTRIGGQLTQDVTQGYGPEMYVLPKAKRGKYTVRAKYFSSDRNRASARTKVHATIIRGYGTPSETVEQRVISLEDNKEMHDLLSFKI